jgi:hypothetical protein
MPAVEYAKVIGEGRAQRDDSTKHRGHQFIFTWRPGAWEVDSGLIVPVLAMEAAADGLNGCSVRYDRAGNPIGLGTGRLRDITERVGGIVIRQDIDAPEHPSYVVRSGPGAYHDRWTTCYPLTDRVSFDRLGFAKWRASLVKRDVVPEPSVGDLEELRTRLINAHKAATVAVGRVPSDLRSDDDEARIKSAKAAISVVDKEIKRRMAGVAPVAARAAEVLVD